MPLTLSPAEGDALYEQVLLQLSGIGDLWLGVGRDSASARFDRQCSDDLRLVLDDLRRELQNGQVFQLTTPPAVLRRVLVLIARIAPRQHATAHLVDGTMRGARDKLVAETCRRGLAVLDW